MGDSETECSYSSAECNSPILYTEDGVPGQEVGYVNNSAIASAPVTQQKPDESFVESQYQDTQILSSQAIGTLDALAGLDSMLENPIPVFGRTAATVTGKSVPPKQLVRAYTQPNMKVRSLDHILAKLSTTNLDKYTLASKLDAQDMKLLINTCGEIVSSKATKSTMLDRLMQLIECGTLDKVFRSVNAVGIPSNKQSGAPSDPALLSAQVRESQTETCIESQALRNPAQRTLSLPLLPPHTQHKQHTKQHTQQQQQQMHTQTALPLQKTMSTSATSESLHGTGGATTAVRVHPSVTARGDDARSATGSSKAVVVMAGAHSEAVDWTPVTDVALLDALNGSDPTAADGAGTTGAPTVQFGTSTCKGKSGGGSGGSGGGVYFAEQPSSAWERCDADTQGLLQDSDSSLQFRRMLQRLSRSKAGQLSSISLSPPVAGAETTAGNASQGTLDSLRSKLRNLVNSGLGSSSLHARASFAQPDSSGSTAAAPAATLDSSSSSSFLSSFDALKLVVFRQDKLGLSLVKQVSVSGVERIVIQSKNHAALDPSADRLLNVGDELVCVQGITLQAISAGAGGKNSSTSSRESSVGINFNAVMECIKQAPRPLQLGFVPPNSTQRSN